MPGSDSSLHLNHLVFLFAIVLFRWFDFHFGCFFPPKLPHKKIILANFEVSLYRLLFTGKTYTMMGWDGDEGIIPRLSREVFARIGGTGDAVASRRIDYKVTLSFLEIYMDNVRDLTISKHNLESKSLTVFHSQGFAGAMSFWLSSCGFLPNNVSKFEIEIP